MRATRRNVLVILGVLTIAGGALFGTGAFTQVEAQRSVDVETSGDADAQLGLNITDDSLAGGSDTIEFAESDVNLNATTRYDGAFNVTNNGNSAITIAIEDSTGNSLIGSGSTMYFQGGSTTLSPGETASFDVVFDTTGTSTQGNVDFPSSITITANEQ